MVQGELTLLYHSLLDPLALLPCSIAPRSHGALIQSEHMHNRLNRAAIREQPYHENNELGWLTQSFQHRAGPSGKRTTTDVTAITLALTIMDRDIAPIGQTACRTRRIGAKLFRRIHRLSMFLLHKHIMPMVVAIFKPPSPFLSPFNGALPEWVEPR